MSSRKIGRPSSFNQELVGQIASLKRAGLTWNQVAVALNITYNQAVNFADRGGLRHLAPPKPLKLVVRRPQPIPRGVPTLAPLPSLMLPLPIIHLQVSDDEDGLPST